MRVGNFRMAIFRVGVFLGGSCPGGNFLSGGFPGWEFLGWKFSWVGGNCLGGIYPRWEFLWWKFSRWEFSGGNLRVAIFRVGVFMLPLIRPNSQSPRGIELHEFNSIAVIFGIYIRNSFRIN